MTQNEKLSETLYFIGVDGIKQVVDSTKTQKQIDRVKNLDCMLTHEDGQLLSWEYFDDETENRTLFQAILKDRELRVDKGVFMANRPLFAVVTAQQGAAVRLEYYEGHDELKLVYDIRSTELQHNELSPFLEKDYYAYNPSAFLRELFGIPEDIS